MLDPQSVLPRDDWPLHTVVADSRKYASPVVRATGSTGSSANDLWAMLSDKLLPCSIGPTNFGATMEASTPWLQLAFSRLLSHPQPALYCRLGSASGGCLLSSTAAHMHSCGHGIRTPWELRYAPQQRSEGERGGGRGGGGGGPRDSIVTQNAAWCCKPGGANSLNCTSSWNLGVQSYNWC